MRSVEDYLLQVQTQKYAFRQREIDSLNKAIHYFLQKKEEFDEYDTVYDLVNYYARGAKSGLIVWGAIVAVIGFFVLVTNLAYSDVNRYQTVTTEDITSILLVSVIPGIMMIAGGILMKVNNRKNYALQITSC